MKFEKALSALAALGLAAAAQTVTAGPSATPSPQAAPASLTGAQAFEKLKTLAGEWSGPIGKADGPRGRVRWEPISGGTAMMETLFPGDAHEMRSVYHLDRGELMLTHYCGAGNQPRMRMSPESTPDRIAFRFDGGTNLDPAKDGHVHDGEIRFLPDGRMEAQWSFFQGGKQVGVNHFFALTRDPAPKPAGK